ncbi:hypothetical protein [endosymbiont 'TC1' of Trimyema compressum]|nr:hypothetical protein [endosymbiont 'TC1' of Trimyema compressum]
MVTYLSDKDECGYYTMGVTSFKLFEKDWKNVNRVDRKSEIKF